MRSVKKIRFTDMNKAAGDTFVSLGGIRLYNKGIMIQSGSLISEDLNVADMQNMIARAKSKYYAHYMVHHAVLTTRSQTGNYSSNGYWIAANGDTSVWYELELKTAQDIDKLQWVQRPDSLYDGRGVANPLNIEFYREDGTLIEKMTVQGDRTRNAVTTLDLKHNSLKYLIENENGLKYWTGSSWTPVPNTG